LVFFLICDIIKIGGAMKKEKKSFKHKILFFTFIVLIVAILILLYARFIETNKLEVNEYRIVNDNFKSIHGYKIAHVSDIHIGNTTDIKYLQKLVDKINLTKPDILFFTGDLIDKDTKLTEKMKEEIEDILSSLDINIKKYSIKGEDDLKFSSYDFIMENAGFISLDDTYETLYLDKENFFLLAGLSSTKDSSKIESKLSDLNDYIENNENKPLYSILIMHEPDFVENIDTQNFNLILAGHSHGGQVKLPYIGGIIYPKYARNYNLSYQKIGDTDLYISSGIGTTTYKFRLFNPPSFNLYRLVSY
jgi:hypothetical protein